MHHNAPRPASRVFTFRVSLDGSDPEIWRRFQMTDNMTLGDLHMALQIVMGWEDCHLHEFELKGKRYAAPAPDDALYDSDAIDEHKTFLGDVLKQKRQKIKYVYDFGDGWQHTSIVEATGEPQEGQHYPICLDGERACPPEDSGSLWGYYSKLEVLQNPEHEEYEFITEWMGDDFDPDAFNVDKVNEALKDFDKMCFWEEDEEEE
jgi:Plasmid pRiA4b ORF-3-like protein